jgi:hypothetical protein
LRKSHYEHFPLFIWLQVLLNKFAVNMR